MKQRRHENRVNQPRRTDTVLTTYETVVTICFPAGMLKINRRGPPRIKHLLSSPGAMKPSNNPFVLAFFDMVAATDLVS